ncbi:hypothetical protein CMV30_03115 [Nibricoccus aquaticus]|uniref:Uncharacterized protein n=1 Tax=Nibricoccus aquaticus TaxID=2576891 RepID=A0A290Q3C6_9BACT|nr:hypothetical protein CMV30_03115 [Nibricoccus aquaticus]
MKRCHARHYAAPARPGQFSRAQSFASRSAAAFARANSSSNPTSAATRSRNRTASSLSRHSTGSRDNASHASPVRVGFFAIASTASRNKSAGSAGSDPSPAASATSIRAAPTTVTLPDSRT